MKISFLKIYLNSLSGLKGYDFVLKGNTIFFGDMEINKLINLGVFEKIIFLDKNIKGTIKKVI